MMILNEPGLAVEGPGKECPTAQTTTEATNRIYRSICRDIEKLLKWICLSTPDQATRT